MVDGAGNHNSSTLVDHNFNICLLCSFMSALYLFFHHKKTDTVCLHREFGYTWICLLTGTKSEFKNLDIEHFHTYEKMINKNMGLNNEIIHTVCTGKHLILSILYSV